MNLQIIAGANERDFELRAGKDNRNSSGAHQSPAMSNTDPSEVPSPTSEASQLRSICDAFRLLWSGTDNPRIEAFVENAPAAIREPAFEELLAIELSQRRARGEKVTIDEYLSRFPDRAAPVQEQFQSNALADTVNASFGVHDSSVTLPPREASSAEIGELTRLGDYEIIERIAQGGMGVVYKAVQPKVGRTVALKTILSGQLATPEEVDRFFIEAEAAAALDHSGIVPVFEAGESEGRHFFSMAFVEGESLADRIREQPLPNREAAKILIRVAEAVQYAHEHGVVHRDLKPANILIDHDGSPRVTDFGLAKNVHADRGLTASGEVLGTPSYMSPEQAGGVNEQIGPSTDVYALGAVLYAVLTGRPPFQAPTVLQTLAQVLGQEPVPPRRLNLQIDRDLDTICLKALEKDPARRYPTAESLGHELERYLRGEPILARPIGRPERVWRWSKRNRRLAALGLSTVVLLLTLSIGGPMVAIQLANSLRNFEAEQERRTQEQLGRLMAARISAVPGILDDIDDKQLHARLVSLAQQDSLSDPDRLRISLALLRQDEGQVAYLKGRLLVATAEELLVIRDALNPHRSDLIEELWAALQESRTTLNAAAALAVYDLESDRWQEMSRHVVDRLVDVTPSQLGGWIEALQPSRSHLLPHLQAIVRNATGTELHRALATDTLATYAADSPAILIDALQYAAPAQFETLFSRLDAPDPDTARHLERALDALGPFHSPLTGITESEFQFTKDDRVARANQQANLIIALMRTGRTDTLWPLLAIHEDATLRGLLIDRFARLGVEPGDLVARLRVESNLSCRRALISALGTYSKDMLPSNGYTSIVADLLDAFERDPDPGIHSACEWTLRRWSEGAAVTQLRERLAASEAHAGSWYVNRQGQTLAIVPPDDATRQLSGNSVELRVEHTFAIGTTEVTREQFERFRQYPANDRLLAETLRKYAPHPDGPAVFWTWYEAADYCNWLSLQEGIPPEEWCYAANADQRYGGGMRIAPDFLSRTGYRLPTQAEWEFACRAGTLNEYSFGDASQLLDRHGWFEDNSGSQAQPVGQQRPNEWGLFDMHGNVWEWGQDVYGGIPADLEDGQFVLSELVMRHWHGGAYDRSVPHLRTGTRDGRQPSLRDMNLGFRVARTIRK